MAIRLTPTRIKGSHYLLIPKDLAELLEINDTSVLSLTIEETSLLPDTRRNLEAIRQFIVDRQLVTIPSEVRAKVEATLPPFRATSFAS